MKHIFYAVLVVIAIFLGIGAGSIQKTSAASQYPPVCGAACNFAADCSGAQLCTSCTNGQCNTPPVCGSLCQTPADCEGAQGCNECTSGQCSPPIVYPPSCGQPCDTDTICEGYNNYAGDGCTKCIPNPTPGADGTCPAGTTKVNEPPGGPGVNNGGGGGAGGVPVATPTPRSVCAPAGQGYSKGICKAPPACGTACNQASDCAGAAQNCTTCTNNKCSKPPACGTACNQASDCAGAAQNCNQCLNNKCSQPPIACGAACNQASDCAGAAQNCTTCLNNKCSAPPACGTACNQASDCAGAAQNCTSCNAGKCAVEPPKCGTPCTNAGDCAGAALNCTQCTSGVCSKPPTPTIVPPAPECAGIEYTSFETGQNTTITSYAKVEGPNARGMKITSQDFFLTVGGDDNLGKKILSSGPITATPVSTSPTLNKYRSVWTFKFPTLTSGKTYRIWSSINFEPVLAFSSSSVAGAHTQQKLSLLAQVVTFVKNIFGIKEKVNYVVVSPTPVKLVTTPKGASVMGVTSRISSLQLGIINPIEVYNKGCYSISFRYNF